MYKGVNVKCYFTNFKGVSVYWANCYSKWKFVCLSNINIYVDAYLSNDFKVRFINT